MKDRSFDPLFFAMDAKARVTAILAGLGGEDADPPTSAEELMPLVYEDLRKRAALYMRRESPGHTLQPTALVHEAYLKLADQSRVSWQGRTHFFAVGANIMRRLLIDHARRRGSDKRGGGWQRVTLTEFPSSFENSKLDPEHLLSLNAALEKLAELDAREAQIVELRFFGGLNMEEVAHVLGVSKRTAEGDWAHARAWLRRELSP